MEDQTWVASIGCRSDIASSARGADVAGLNRIGALLDDIRKQIQSHGEQALRLWVEAAKLLVVAADVHGLKGANFVQFANSHMSLDGACGAARA